jgi:alkaline phosphatase D
MLDTRIIGRDQEVDSKTDPKLLDDKRQLLGAEQEAWLGDRLGKSTAKWQLLGQQVVVASFPVFFNSDAWDGYPGARERLNVMLETNAAKNVVVLTGDIHMSFAFELPRDPKSPDYDPKTGKGSLGVEFVVPGVTSPGMPEQLANVATGLVQDNRHLKFANVHQKGYVVLDITHERVQGAWYHYTDPSPQQGVTPQFTAAWSVKAGTKALYSDTEAK